MDQAKRAGISTPQLPVGQSASREPVVDAGEILTVADAAKLMHGSKAHVYNLIRGKVHALPPLPSIALGRKKLIRRSSLEAWLLRNENNGTMSSPQKDGA